AVGGPLRHAGAIHPLGVDVAVAEAIVVPGDDGAARGVGDSMRVDLIVRRRAENVAVGRPLGNAQGVQALGVDVRGDAATGVLPGDDRAARLVTHDRGL